VFAWGNGGVLLFMCLLGVMVTTSCVRKATRTGVSTVISATAWPVVKCGKCIKKGTVGVTKCVAGCVAGVAGGFIDGVSKVFNSVVGRRKGSIKIGGEIDLLQSEEGAAFREDAAFEKKANKKKFPGKLDIPAEMKKEEDDYIGL